MSSLVIAGFFKDWSLPPMENLAFGGVGTGTKKEKREREREGEGTLPHLVLESVNGEET